ncbi:MAG: HEAT repeat domain-containing protein [Caldilinea sp.]
MMKNGRKSGFDDAFGNDRNNRFGDEFGDEFGEEFDEEFVIAPDEAWDEEGASDFAPAPDWTVDELLRRLSVAPDDVPLNEYFALSDLTREEVETVRRHWIAIDVASRLRTVDVLARGVEEFLDVDIGAFLAAIIDDPDADVRQLVLETLNENEPRPELLGPIIYRLQHDSADEVRAAAAAVLGHYVLAGELDELDAAPAIRAEDALFAVLTDANEPMIVQRRALESIAYSGEIAVRQFIEDAYYSPWEEMRVSALIAMGRSADIRWRRMARAELRNPSPAMRAEAAIACGELEAKAALSDLLDLLTDDEQPVRLAAIFALGRIGGKQARRALEEIAASEDEEALEAEMALEDMLFYTGADAAAIPLFDEREDEDVLDDLDPWDDWDDDDDDLGEYE